MLCIFALAVIAQENTVSKTWVSDLGNGRYKNPILNADYPDPDVCRVGDDYYMTISSFNCIPGLPILHSKDLVNWTIIGHAIERLFPDSVFSKVVHGGGVYAPSIRYHKGEFYIYYGDPDYGIFMTKTSNPAGDWEPVVMVKEGKGLIDPCPLFDDDGQVYMVYAFAGSRARINSLLAVTRLTADGKKAIGEARIVYDGHDVDVIIEGSKFHKRNGLYYIFAPAGGVAYGWQVVLKADNPYGPYERRKVLAQGKTKINGAHQGAWVDTQTGEDWFFHFQHVNTLGRRLHLQPMVWNGDWPVIGEDKDGDGCGDPVLEHKKPNVGKTYPITTPAESDEFNTNKLGLQWQWHANSQPWWHFANQSAGCLTLFSVPFPNNGRSLWDVPNLLLQKMPAPIFTATMKLTMKPNPRFAGERTGLLLMGRDYALLSFENKGEGMYAVSQIDCYGAEKGMKEVVNASAEVKDSTIYLRLTMKDGYIGSFSYSTDNKKFESLGKTFKARSGVWIGAKVGTFLTRPVKSNDGGRVEIDWFRIEK